MPLHQAIILFGGGIVAGVIGSFLIVGGGILIVPLLVFVVKVPLHYAIATALMCVIASSNTARAQSVWILVAVPAAFIYYARGDVRPEITSAALLGVFVGSIRLKKKLRLTVALSGSLFLVGLLADSVDPIAFGTIAPSHIPLLPRALIHGSPAAMMHVGILIVLVTPVVRLVYSYCVESFD
jgi:hypothetical protein